jgi:hypothetical protein
MPWHRAILNLCRPVPDRHRINNLPTGLPRCAGRFTPTHDPTAAQMCHQLFLQYTTGLNEQAFIDRFATDMQGLVSVERDLEPSRYLLG